MSQISLMPGLEPEEIPKKKGAFQQVLEGIMKDRGLDTKTIAKDAGIPESTVYAWANGERVHPNCDESLRKLMQYFNIHLETLVFGIGDEEEVFEMHERKSILTKLDKNMSNESA